MLSRQVAGKGRDCKAEAPGSGGKSRQQSMPLWQMASNDCRPESREVGDRKVGEIEVRVVFDAALLADACKWLTVQATRPNPHRPGSAKPTRIGINQAPVPEALHRLNKALSCTDTYMYTRTANQICWFYFHWPTSNYIISHIPD